jgi:nicotinate phosphoribosyltransferase
MDRSEHQQRLGLFTDLYELRMAQTCLQHGHTAPATFSLYTRPSSKRPWLVAAGAAAAVEAIERFTYDRQDLDYLAGQGMPAAFLDWLGDLQPAGELWTPPDGTVMLADEPLLEATAPLPQAMLMETALLSVVQLPTLIATKAARCASVARGALLADFGARRAHGLEAGVEAARAAYLGGIDATSNVEAGRRHGIPITGTMAHSFVQAWDGEEAAFTAFAMDHPDHSVLLVDTYDTLEGVRRAIRAGERLRSHGQRLDGIRLDSGDLGALAQQARRMLDDAGFDDARIIASGGLDEYAIADLTAAGAPIDGFGIGTSLTVSSDLPALDIVYKLVAYDGVPRAKYSEDKVLLPGPKQVFRTGAPDGDVLGRRDEDLPGRALLEPIWRDGRRLRDFDLEQARDRAREQVERLPASWLPSRQPDHPPGPQVSAALRELADQVRARDLSGS